MTTTHPYFSIIIPVYNSEAFVADAIDSVLGQSFNDWELIVVDDGSTDSSKDIILSYGPKLSYLYQENKGLAGARNAGLTLACGSHVIFLDSDDILMDNACQLHADNFHRHPEVAVSAGGWVFINRDKSHQTPPYSPLDRRTEQPNLLTQIALCNFLTVCGCAVRRDVIDSIGGFDERLIAIEDSDFWVRCLYHNFSFSLFAEPVFKYRRHNESMTVNYSRQETAGDIVVDKWFSEGPLQQYYHPWRARVHAARLFRLAGFYKNKENYAEADRCERRAREFLAAEPGSLCAHYITMLRKRLKQHRPMEALTYFAHVIRLSPWYALERASRYHKQMLPAQEDATR